MRGLRWTIRLLLFSLLVACGDYHQNYSGDPNTSGDPTHGFKTLSFAAVSSIVFQPYCSTCHSATHGNKGNVNLETFPNTTPHLADILTDIQSGKMPDTGALPDYPKVLILAWLQNKAPENSNIPMPDPHSKPPPPPPPPPPGFDQVSSSIFQPYCSRCHSQISDYDYVIANLKNIQNDVANNTMPKNQKPLSTKLKALLAAWVAAGTPKGFGEISRKILVPYCIRCHAGFSKYNTVAGEIDDIQDKLATDEMPKNADPLPDDLKVLLDNWIKAGIPN